MARLSRTMNAAQGAYNEYMLDEFITTDATPVVIHQSSVGIVPPRTIVRIDVTCLIRNAANTLGATMRSEACFARPADGGALRTVGAPIERFIGDMSPEGIDIMYAVDGNVVTVWVRGPVGSTLNWNTWLTAFRNQGIAS